MLLKIFPFLIIIEFIIASAICGCNKQPKLAAIYFLSALINIVFLL